MNKNERIKWAAAIAKRISDEWDGSKQFPEDAALLRGYLQKTLSKEIGRAQSELQSQR